MKNTKAEPLISKYIIGRVLPHIYAFKTNSVPNALKVGDTYRPVSVRLNEWKKYYPNLQKQYEGKATVDNDTKFFRDYSVHDFLENDKRKKHLLLEEFPAEYYSREFFNNATVKEIESAIEDINKNYGKTNKYQYYSMDKVPETFTYQRESVWDLRDNQKQAVDNFVKAVNEKHKTNLLMYAVMRFGKSFTSLCCAKEINAKLVLVVSAKADVKDEWKKNVEKPGNFSNFVFLDEHNLRNENAIHDALQQSNVCVVFLTLQDLQGSNIKEKHKELFQNDVDLLIIDETHFGARANKYGEILRDKHDKRDTEDCVSEKDEKVLKELHSKIKLHLSGTPYRILMSDEFTPDDIICFCQYTDIIDEQSKWDYEHQEEDEWKNPYYGFPQMVRFAFNPNKTTQNKLDELRKNNVTYAFSEFFKPLSVTKNADNLHKKFKYENEVLELLKVIDGSNNNEKLLGFLDYPQIKQGKMCRHIVCVLPFKASCDALTDLINAHENEFKNLNEYEIINIAGVDNPSEYKKIESVKNKIKECEKKNKKTLTLTVNRMLTGTTVPEWDTMLYFKDTASPQEYDQSIFRLQNQYVVNYKDEKGNTIKYNMKPQTLLVDFDPNRMFQMQEEKAKIYNVNIEQSGNTKLKQRIEKELSISPIILLNTDKISEIKEADIMKAVSEYSNNKGVADEVQSISVDLALMKNAELMAEISKQPELGSKEGLSFNASDENNDGDDLDTGEEITQTEETSNLIESEQLVTANSNKDNAEQRFIKQMQTYYARILFFAFLTQNKVVSLDDIIKKINSDENNKRIAKNLGLKLKILQLLNTMNAFKLSDLDYKIQNLNTLANDQSIEPLERAKVAITKFARLSSSEIQTPSKICDEMVDLIHIKDYKKIVNSGSKILDIASKSGEFATALFKKLYNKCDKNKLTNSIYSIPTSTIAYEFTRKIYDVLGLNVNNISKFTSYDLLNVKNGNDIDCDKIKELLTQSKNFDKILLNDEIKGGKKVKFDTVVGNPPYQETIREASEGNNKNTVDIFNDFQNIALKLSNETCMIYPAKDFQRGKKNLLDKKIVSLRIYNGSSRQGEKHIPDEPSVFGDAVRRIPGDVCIIHCDNNNEDDQKVYYQDTLINRTGKILPVRKDLLSIANKLLSEVGTFNFSKIGKVCESNFVQYHKNSVLNKEVVREEVAPNGYVKVLTNDKAGSGGKAKWFYIKKTDLDRQQPEKNKIVITSAYPNEAFDNPKNFDILKYDEFFGRSKLAIYDNDDIQKVKECLKYLNTKFAKTINLMTPYSFLYYLPDFDTIYDSIDWSKSIPEIDQQLYKKYNLTQEEIDFIESKVKPME